jgi:hypothetical protein
MKKLLLPLLALAAFALPARAAIDLEAIQPDGFARGVAFTVNGYDANRPPLTNFPVLVRISETGISGFDYEDVYSHTANGTTVPHLAFTDAEGNALAFDVDTWNNSSTSLVWATLPVMTNGAEFAMFWRATEASANAAAGGNAFTNYVGVWHLGESGDGQQTINDSSTNGLVATSSSRSLAKTDGKIGGARQITNVREKNVGERGILVTSTSAAITALNKLGTDFTVSFWLRPQGKMDNTNNTNPNQGGIGYDALISRKDATTTPVWALQFMDSPTKMRMWTCQTDDKKMKTASGISLTRYAWSKMDVVYKAAGNGTYALYVDGALVMSETGAGVVGQGSLTLDIGGYVGGAERSFLGDMDEVRVGPFTPGLDWVKADYDQATNTTFLSHGTTVEFEEAKNPVASFALEDWGAAFAQFSGSITVCGGEATACTVYARAYPTGSTESEWTLLASGLAAGDTFSGVLVDLLPQTDYTYEIKAVNNLAEPLDSVVATDTFTTSGAGEIGSGGDAKRVRDSIVHTFKIARDGTDTFEFVPPSYATSVEALVVAGGGPGGYYAGGGGGAGGLVYNAALGVTGGATYLVTVGAGGAASSSETERGATGGNSLVASNGGSVTNALAFGGGAGGNGERNGNAEAVRVGADGASGGGGGGRSTKGTVGYSGGSGSNGQGNSGGAGLLEKLVGGGGGGAGGAGAAVSGSGTVGGGGGGNGIEYSISGTPTYYAGGGGGGGKENSKDGAYGYPGSGGRGGGGNGGMYTVANAGTEVCSAGAAGTGGGGGGGATYGGFFQGGDGGSGIVILRYDVKGNGAGMTTPAVALESLDRVDDTNAPNHGLTTIEYRVAWAGDTYDYADVLVVWGFRKGELDHTNSIAVGVIGRGTGTFTLPDQTRTVYVRALATNAVAGALSPEIETIPFVNPEAPEATVSVTATDQHTATFTANVTGLGNGATSVSGVFQVCSDEDFEEGTYLTFPASGTLTTAGTLTGTASGLAFNTAYFVRASLTNNLPEFFETEPVEFRTKVLGAPSGSVKNDETYPVQVGSTTITATGQLWNPGTGATTATVRLEASTTADFATFLFSESVENQGEKWYATLTVTGLEPETDYYLRLRMENEGHMVQRSTVVGPFTTVSGDPNLMLLVW